MNFTYALRIPSDKKFGNKKSDGSYNGMIGELTKHNADMGMSTYVPNNLPCLSSCQSCLALHREVKYSMVGVVFQDDKEREYSLKFLTSKCSHFMWA